MMKCWVRLCPFKAEHWYGGDLPLCALHNVSQTHAIIEDGDEPMFCWMMNTNTPLVVPCGTLEYRAPVEADDDAIFPHECPMLAQAATSPTVHPAFNLMELA